MKLPLLLASVGMSILHGRVTVLGRLLRVNHVGCGDCVTLKSLSGLAPLASQVRTLLRLGLLVLLVLAVQARVVVRRHNLLLSLVLSHLLSGQLLLQMLVAALLMALSVLVLALYWHAHAI